MPWSAANTCFDPWRDPGPVPSPCVSLCRLDGAGECEGCGRTRDEIAAWRDADDATRRAVWRRLLPDLAPVGDAAVDAPPAGHRA